MPTKPLPPDQQQIFNEVVAIMDSFAKYNKLNPTTFKKQVAYYIRNMIPSQPEKRLSYRLKEEMMSYMEVMAGITSDQLAARPDLNLDSLFVRTLLDNASIGTCQ